MLARHSLEECRGILTLASVGLRDAFCKFRALPRAQAREE
jgi:hypothetical protein